MTDAQDQINIQALKDHYDNDEEIIKIVLDTFLTNIDDTLAKVDQAIKEKNAQDLELYAHTLKGSVRNVFVDSLIHLAQEMENLGKKSEFEKAEELFLDLNPRFNLIKEKVNDLWVSEYSN